jgi:hypothetical protein
MVESNLVNLGDSIGAHQLLWLQRMVVLPRGNERFQGGQVLHMNHRTDGKEFRVRGQWVLVASVHAMLMCSLTHRASAAAPV